MEKEHKRSRGFGFVKFQDVQVARALLSKSQTKSGLKMRGKRIDLKVAVPKETEKKKSGAKTRVQEGYVVSESYYYTTMLRPTSTPELMINEDSIPASFVAYHDCNNSSPSAHLNEQNILIPVSQQSYIPMMGTFDQSYGLHYPYPVFACGTPLTDPTHTATQSAYYCSPNPNA